MAKKLEIKESTDYENCLDLKANSLNDNPFAELIPEIQSVEDTDNKWKKHWVSMPEFEQEENPTYKTVYFHFRNKEDFEEFCDKYFKLMDNDQKITDKTKSLWYPHLDRTANALLRWIEEE